MGIKEYIQQIMNRTRKYAAFFEFGRNKPRKELGIVESFFESMKAEGVLQYQKPGCSEKDPPDCYAFDNNGGKVGFEVAELVSEEAVKSNEKGNNVYRDWSASDVVNALEKIIQTKDSKKYRGGPYAKIILVIHTDEMTIIRNDEMLVAIKSHFFGRTRMIDEVYLLFSYDPSMGSYPSYRLRVEKDSSLINL